MLLRTPAKAVIRENAVKQALGECTMADAVAAFHAAGLLLVHPIVLMVRPKRSLCLVWMMLPELAFALAGAHLADREKAAQAGIGLTIGGINEKGGEILKIEPATND